MPIDKAEFEKVKLDSKQLEQQEEQGFPAYFRPTGIADREEDQQRIIEEIFEEFKAIKEERDEAGIDEKAENLYNQYKGILEENADRQFNLNRPTTKIHVRGICRAAHSSFFEVDPTYNIAPRPEFASEGGADVCEHQTDFLDYKLDTEECYRDAKRKVLRWAVIFGTGIEKLYHKIKRVNRTRHERWKGEPIERIDPRTGLIVTENKPLTEFLNKYEDPPKQYVKALMEGKEINVKVEFKETVKNDAATACVDPRNFYVRLSCNGYEGLCEQRLIVERVEYYWHELKKEEQKGMFYGIDDLAFEYHTDKKSGNTDINRMRRRKGYKSDKYSILQCTYMAELEEGDEETRCVFWIDEDRKVMIGDTYFPWEGIESIYNPHYVIKEEDGFYQPGVAEDLTDLNIAENAFLNFGLEGAWISNMVTPLTPKNSDIDKQFMSGTWMHGLPLNVGKDEKPDFLQRYLKPTSLSDVIAILQTIAKAQDDVTGYSQLMTGRESEIDPDAPGNKTIALLNRSSDNIRDYIVCLLPAFNRTAEMMLQIYYQISREGRAYSMKAERQAVSKGEPFPTGTLERHEMIARTNIQARALGYDFDKLNEKKLDVALYQIIRRELMIAKRPEAVHTLLKNIIKGWSPKWKNIIEKILPPLQQIRQEEAAVAIQAAASYLGMEVQKAKQKGIPVDVDIQRLIGVVSTARKEIATPPSPEEQKMREKARKEASK